jgi:hypothetical protein
MNHTGVHSVGRPLQALTKVEFGADIPEHFTISEVRVVRREISWHIQSLRKPVTGEQKIKKISEWWAVVGSRGPSRAKLNSQRPLKQ